MTTPASTCTSRQRSRVRAFSSAGRRGKSGKTSRYEAVRRAYGGWSELDKRDGAVSRFGLHSDIGISIAIACTRRSHMRGRTRGSTFCSEYEIPRESLCRSPESLLHSEYGAPFPILPPSCRQRDLFVHIVDERTRYIRSTWRYLPNVFYGRERSSRYCRDLCSKLRHKNKRKWSWCECELTVRLAANCHRHDANRGIKNEEQKFSLRYVYLINCKDD